MDKLVHIIQTFHRKDTGSFGKANLMIVAVTNEEKNRLKKGFLQ